MANYSKTLKDDVIASAKLQVENTKQVHATPQSQPIPGRESEMVKNNAGGYAFTVSPLDQFMRFMIMGAPSTYYASAKNALSDNVYALEMALQEVGVYKVVELIETLSEGNRARQDSAIFALAWLSVHPHDLVKAEAYRSIGSRKVIRTLRQLYDLVYQRYLLLEGKGGWGSGFRHSVANWFNSMPPRTLAMQFLKYRGGQYTRPEWRRSELVESGKRWSSKLELTPGTLLGAAHVTPTSDAQSSLYNYVAARNDQTRATIDVFFADQRPPSKRTASLGAHGEAFDLIWAFEQAQRAKTAREIVNLIKHYGLTWEMIPNTWFSRNEDNINSAREIWTALIGVGDSKWPMPMGALLRNLSRLTGLGLLSEASVRSFVIERFVGDGAEQRIREAHLHPIEFLDAWRVYSSGVGREGSSVWTPVPAISDMLEAAFYLSFETIVPSGKNLLLALDCSGSMGWGTVNGLPGLTPREATACMVMVTARREPGYQIVGFTTTLKDLGVRATDNLEAVQRTIALADFGRTDCAQPMIWAQNRRETYDGFAVYTDNETWAGDIQPTQALRNYRLKKNPEARLAVVGMTSTGFTIADPRDRGMMDFVGFDSGAPRIMSDFFAGRL